MGRSKQLYQFVTNPFSADGSKFVGKGSYRRQGFGLNVKLQLSGQADGPQYAQMVLCKTLLRHADRADQPGSQIILAANPVMQLLRYRVIKQTVYGEVPAPRVGSSVPEADLSRVPAVLVIGFGPKS